MAVRVGRPTGVQAEGDDIQPYRRDHRTPHDQQMVMYVDLLTQALGRGEEGHRSDVDLLLADLVHSRARLRATEREIRTSVVEALARELSYDGALIRLCESLDVPTTPDRFANPVRERARLEREHAIALSPERDLEPQYT